MMYLLYLISQNADIRLLFHLCLALLWAGSVSYWIIRANGREA